MIKNCKYKYLNVIFHSAYMSSEEERTSPHTDDGISETSSHKSSIQDDLDEVDELDDADEDEQAAEEWEGEAEDSDNSDDVTFVRPLPPTSSADIGRLYICPADEHPKRSNYYSHRPHVESGQFSDAD